jgi:CBS domain containing-hemolysin-like protein
MSLIETVGWWALAIASLFLASVIAGVELGCYSLNRVRLNLRAERGRNGKPDPAARILRKELDRPDRMLTTILIGYNIFSYLSAVALTSILESRDRPHWEVAVINVLILAPMILIVGDALPKEIFRQRADTLTYRFAGALRALRYLLTAVGLVPLVVGAGRVTERLFGLREDLDVMSDARQRLVALLKESASGVLSDAQTSLVDRAVALKQTSVGDEMVPWARVATIPVHWDTKRAAKLLVDIEHSRLPVVDARGQVVGVVRQIDLYTRPDAPLERLLARPARLDPRESLRDGLEKVRMSGVPLAIVERDGRPVGIATVRDLVEPLTGELPDW